MSRDVEKGIASVMDLPFDDRPRLWWTGITFSKEGVVGSFPLAEIGGGGVRGWFLLDGRGVNEVWVWRACAGVRPQDGGSH